MTNDEWMEFLKQSIESHDRQIGDLAASIQRLVEVTNRDATAIRTLAKIADLPERRIGDIEESLN